MNINTTKVIREQDHDELVEMVIRFAKQRKLTQNNIERAAEDVAKYMRKNAVIEE